MSQDNESIEMVGKNRMDTAGNYGVETNVTSGERIVESGIHISASYSPTFGHVTMGVGYDDEDASVGALARMTPEQARQLAAKLEGLADHVDELESVEPSADAEPESIFRRLFS